MIHFIDSDKSIEEIEKSLPQAAQNNKFGVLGTHNLKQKMNEKGVDFEKDCLVFEVCNPQKAGQILHGNMAISAVLPCRISVYREGGKTRLATIKPSALLAMFANPELQPVAKEVEATLLKIMREAAA